MGLSLSLTNTFEEKARLLLEQCNGVCNAEQLNVEKDADLRSEEELLLTDSARGLRKSDDNKCSRTLERLSFLLVSEDIEGNLKENKLSSRGRRSDVMRLASAEPSLFGKLMCYVTALGNAPTEEHEQVLFKVGHLNGQDLTTANGLGLGKVLYYVDSRAGYALDKCFYKDDAGIYDAMGVLLAHDGDTYALAKISASLAVLIDPSNLRYTLNLVQMCQKTGDVKTGVSLLESATTRFPDNGIIFWRLGLFYIQNSQGNLKGYLRAHDCLRRACELDPTNLEFLHSLVTICDLVNALARSLEERLQVNNEAIAALMKIQDLDPSSRVADRLSTYQTRNNLCNFELETIR